MIAFSEGSVATMLCLHIPVALALALQQLNACAEYQQIILMANGRLGCRGIGSPGSPQHPIYRYATLWLEY